MANLETLGEKNYFHLMVRRPGSTRDMLTCPGHSYLHKRYNFIYTQMGNGITAAHKQAREVATGYTQ